MHMELYLLLSITAFLGVISVSKSLVTFLNWVWTSFLRHPRDLKQYGLWAIVTGPTDGIGKAITMRLAEKGFNLVLIGRSKAKLDVVEIEIRKKYGKHIELRSVAFDLSGDTDEGIDRLELATKGLDIGILVNNTAATIPHRFLHEVSMELLDTVLRVNIYGMMRITGVVLPAMLKKKRGAIINIGAGAARMSSYPLGSVYSSTKAFLLQFSKSLSVEYKKYGIDVQCQTPLFVATKMTKMRPSFFVPTPDEYAKWCLRFVGYEAECISLWIHALQFWLLRAVPDVILSRCLFRMNLKRQEKSMHEEKLKKQAR